MISFAHRVLAAVAQHSARAPCCSQLHEALDLDDVIHCCGKRLRVRRAVVGVELVERGGA